MKIFVILFALSQAWASTITETEETTAFSGAAVRVSEAQKVEGDRKKVISYRLVLGNTSLCGWITTFSTFQDIGRLKRVARCTRDALQSYLFPQAVFAFGQIDMLPTEINIAPLLALWI